MVRTSIVFRPQVDRLCSCSLKYYKQKCECRHPGRNRCARRVCSVCIIYKRYAVAEMRMPAPGRNHVPGVHAEMPVSYMQQIQMRKHLARARPPTRWLWQGAGPINNLQKNGASTPKWACPHPQLRLAIILWPFRLGSTETKILSEVCWDKWKLE